MTRTFSLDECAIAYTPPETSFCKDTMGEIKVGPLRNTRWADPYDMTWELSLTRVLDGRTVETEQQKLDELLFLFHFFVAGWKMDSRKVHQAFLSINEYVKHWDGIGFPNDPDYAQSRNQE